MPQQSQQANTAPKTVAVVAASDFNDEHFLGCFAARIFDEVIAVDGGFASLQSIGSVPNLAIGDFDSLGYVPKDVPAQQFPTHKDESDLELAMNAVHEAGAQTIYVYGAFGGRLDHTIANVQLLARYAEMGHDIVAIGTQEVVHYLVGPGMCELPPCQAGTVVSVFSLKEESQGVTEQGLVYPLEDATLTNRTTLGLSNEFTGSRASVYCESGTLIIIRAFVPKEQN